MSDQSRRKLLKSIAAGSGAVVAGKSLPESWSRPVVDSVLLPAHAQTSSVNFVVTGVVSNESNPIQELLIPSAHAAMVKNICMNATGNSVSVEVTIDGNTSLYTGAYSLPFGLSPLVPSPANGTAVQISGALAADGNSVTGSISVDGSPSDYTAPKSTGSCQLSPDEQTIYAIGDIGPCGGKVFYITNGGLNGLEAALADQGSAEWGCYATVTGATATGVGSGSGNTAAILAAGVCASGSAAELASNYAGGGCSGWFLPSKDELNLLYQQKDVVGGFASTHYWSSSEFSALNARFQLFFDGFQNNYNKFVSLRVRAVRGF